MHFKKSFLIVASVFMANLSSEEANVQNSFVGTWCGKWDNLYATCFTVNEENKNYTALYTWEEQIGQNRQKNTLRGFQINDNTINFENKIIVFDLTNPNNATAFGIFESHSRLANLTRQEMVE